MKDYQVFVLLTATEVTALRNVLGASPASSDWLIASQAVEQMEEQLERHRKTCENIEFLKRQLLNKGALQNV